MALPAAGLAGRLRRAVGCALGRGMPGRPEPEQVAAEPRGAEPPAVADAPPGPAEPAGIAGVPTGASAEVPAAVPAEAAAGVGKLGPAKPGPAKPGPPKPRGATASGEGARGATASGEGPRGATARDAGARDAGARDAGARDAKPRDVRERPARARPARAQPAEAGAKAPVRAGAAGTSPTRSTAFRRTVAPPRAATAESWSEDELAAIRAELDEQAEDLRAEIAGAEAEWIALQRNSAGEGAGDDQADAGTVTVEREHDLALATNSRSLLAQVERALRRLDEGTYGACESCGEPIGKLRLKAFPRVTLCVACKQREERR